jgi:hypothetical protein
MKAALALMLGLAYSPWAQAQPKVWAAASVRVVADLPGGTIAGGSGVILGHDGRVAVVLTAAHILEGVETIRVYRPGGPRGYRAAYLTAAGGADLAALLIHDSGDLPTLELAAAEGGPGILAAFGRGRTLRLEAGEYQETIAGTAMYGFFAQAGDSGGGVFTREGALLGINWGRGLEGSAAVDLETLREFVARPKVARYRRRGYGDPARAIANPGRGRSPNTDGCMEGRPAAVSHVAISRTAPPFTARVKTLEAGR